MSIFGSIASAIFGSSHAASAAAAAGASTPPSTAAAPSAGAAAAKPISQADVQAIVAKLADEQDVVDLMKLLKLDSSLGARKQLAQELGYTGARDGSAEMNIWLHKQVMTKLAESGGKVPESLKA
jgi:hypothetical protein